MKKPSWNKGFPHTASVRIIKVTYVLFLFLALLSVEDDRSELLSVFAMWAKGNRKIGKTNGAAERGGKFERTSA